MCGVCCCLSVSSRGDVVKLAAVYLLHCVSVFVAVPCARTAAIYTQRVQVVLHNGVSQEVQLRAYLHATYLAATLNQVRCVDARQQLCTRRSHKRTPLTQADFTRLLLPAWMCRGRLPAHPQRSSSPAASAGLSRTCLASWPCCRSRAGSWTSSTCRAPNGRRSGSRITSCQSYSAVILTESGPAVELSKTADQQIPSFSWPSPLLRPTTTAVF